MSWVWGGSLNARVQVVSRLAWHSPAGLRGTVTSPPGPKVLVVLVVQGPPKLTAWVAFVLANAGTRSSHPIPLACSKHWAPLIATPEIPPGPLPPLSETMTREGLACLEPACPLPWSRWSNTGTDQLSLQKAGAQGKRFLP